MLYLNAKDIDKIGIDWDETIKQIEVATKLIQEKNYSQPLKPYLRYNNLENRIIAMPAYVGGDIDCAGIKWIASFPHNIKMGKPRASSVTILNESETGEIKAVINTAKLSMIRTASVTGAVLKKYLDRRMKTSYKIGIIGFGPIGQHHLRMVEHVMKGLITDVYIYDEFIDVCADSIVVNPGEKVHISDSWEEIMNEVDILITCTASKERYIISNVREGFVALHVSLRDYTLDSLKQFDKPVYTDDWTEVNRENTDIEYMSLNGALNEEESKSIVDIICNNAFEMINERTKVLFAPMGMATFDIAISELYLQKALKSGVGLELK